MFDALREGVFNPDKILPFLLAKTVPYSVLDRAKEMKPIWQDMGDFYTFTEGGFVGGAKDRAGFCARNYYEISQCINMLDKHDIYPALSIEIGSGYGRLSPWIAQRSSQHYGIEPNKIAYERAKALYPDISWVQGKIQDIDIKDEADLIVSWTVLQHIPPTMIDKSIFKIVQLLSDEGYLLICEETEGQSGRHTWPRSIETYRNMFDRYDVLEIQERQLEPTAEYGGGNVILFKVS